MSFYVCFKPLDRPSPSTTVVSIKVRSQWHTQRNARGYNRPGKLGGAASIQPTRGKQGSCGAVCERIIND